MRCLIALLFSASITHAGITHAGGKSGEFDYYVLALSWSPTWCAIEGDRRKSPQCKDDADFGWVLHGLWPQYHLGWPSKCPTTERAPSRAMTRGMADIMGSSGSAWHQWNKHGVCSGLSAADYYALARQAYNSVNRPEVFRKIDDPIKVPAKIIEEAFIKANPGWEADMLTITCKQNRIQEARLCLSKDLAPVPCGADVVRDCTMKDALFDPIR